MNAITVGTGLGLAFLFQAALAAEPAVKGNWPHWRGPTGNGVSPDGKPPVSWGPNENVRWRVKIPGRGSASPIVWGDKVFVVTAIAAGKDAPPAGTVPGRGESSGEQDGEAERRERRESRQGGRRSGRGEAPIVAQRFVLIAIDRSSGKTLFERTAVESVPHQGHHQDHGFASASPCTDGELVYAHFGSRGLFAYDLEGKLRWQRKDFGAMDTRNGFGEGSSPTVHGGVVVVPWDHEGPSAILALDARDGRTLWKTERDEPSSWGTPLVVEHGGKKQVVTTGEKFARGYDLQTGKELWRSSGQTGRPIASPVAGHDLVFIGSGFRGAYLGAFRLDRTGNIDGTDGIAWSLNRHTPDVPSPLLSEKRLYFLSGRSNILSCHDAVSGKPHYSATRVEGLGNVYASPVAAAGKVYFTGRDGKTIVIEDSDALAVVGRNTVGEPVDATPAIAGAEIYIRGEEHLFALAK